MVSSPVSWGFFAQFRQKSHNSTAQLCYTTGAAAGPWSSSGSTAPTAYVFLRAALSVLLEIYRPLWAQTTREITLEGTIALPEPEVTREVACTPTHRVQEESTACDWSTFKSVLLCIWDLWLVQICLNYQCTGPSLLIGPSSILLLDSNSKALRSELTPPRVWVRVFQDTAVFQKKTEKAELYPGHFT